MPLKQLALAVALMCIGCASVAHAEDARRAEIERLGRALFFDRSLSLSRTQSCASCHDPARAFSEPSDGRMQGAVPTSADGQHIGDRNAPSLSYTALVPAFSRTPDGNYVGGLFHDGRAADLQMQVEQPLLNPIEMQMPDAAAVVARVGENAAYVRAFNKLYRVSMAGAVQPAFAAIARAVEAFERTPEFVAFDSRYDRALRGELELNDDEAHGRDLFFSGVTNCSSCHLLSPSHASGREPFTNNRYFNIGVPVNRAVRELNGLGTNYVDLGLAANPALHDASMAGKFRAPSLRNVAVTSPYMHNGVFRKLETVLFFYNQYQGRSAAFAINPESGAPWGAPEVAHTIDHALLRAGQPMEAERIRLLVVFLRALTDKRYEPLLVD